MTKYDIKEINETISNWVSESQINGTEWTLIEALMGGVQSLVWRAVLPAIPSHKRQNNGSEENKNKNSVPIPLKPEIRNECDSNDDDSKLEPIKPEKPHKLIPPAKIQSSKKRQIGHLADDKSGEIWVDIPDIEGYQVSSAGQVRSFLRKGGKKGLSDTPRIVTKRVMTKRGTLITVWDRVRKEAKKIYVEPLVSTLFSEL